MSLRFWCFTEFNEQRVNSYREWIEGRYNEGGITYIVCQKEQCPDTNRVHVQGYVVFENRKRIGGVKTALGSTTVHVERRRGTHDEAASYCKKEESRCEEGIELGEFDDRGNQSKCLEEVKEKIKRGATELEIAEEHFGIWCRYYQAFAKYRLLGSRQRDFKTTVRVYWGPPGTGKSRRATAECGGMAYRKPLGEWWDGYDGSSNVIIDDFYGWIRFDELLRCLDRYAHRVPVKGGFVNFAPELLIITSNAMPRCWYNVETIDDYRFAALTRRLDTVEHMVDNWEPIENEE
ncbi:putative Rep protein [Circo-like virus Croatia 17_S17]|nr:putative Rep protein [Circo-like virus Croatia 17_S17]